MITFKFHHTDYSNGIGLGLTAKNVKELKNGKMLLIELNEFGFKAIVGIVYGNNEELLMKDVDANEGRKIEVDR